MDAWLERMYERFGRWYVIAAIVALILPGLALVPALLILPARYQQLSIGEYWIACLLGVGGITLAAGLILFFIRGALRPMFAWSAGERSDELAASVGEWAFKTPRRGVALVIALAALIALPVVTLALVLPSEYQGAPDVIAIAIGVLGTIGALAVYGYAGLEFALRPVRASVGRHDLPAAPSPGLALTLASPLLIIFLVGGGTGYLITDRSSGDTGLLVAWAVSLTITAVSAIPFLLLAFGVVLAPLRDLIGGHRDVTGGGLPRIPVTATDEIGELTASFNRMVDGLQEREALRGENIGLVAELRASRARIVAAADESRRKVERDLHDGAQQNLVLLNLQLGRVERAVAADPDASRLVAESRAELERALGELRDLAHGIYPQVLTSDGLEAALTRGLGPLGDPGENRGGRRRALSGRDRGRGLLLLPRGAPERVEARRRRSPRGREAL